MEPITLIAGAAIALALVMLWNWWRTRSPGRVDLRGPLGMGHEGLFGWLAGGVRTLRRLVYGWRDPYWARLDWALQLCGPDGELKDERIFRNLVVNAGLDGILQRGFNTAGVINVFDWIAIGTDATGELATDVALGVELVRSQAAFAAGGTGVCTLTFTFAAGVGTGAIVEAGLFDTVGPAPAGVMFSRKTFAVINKAAGDTLKVVITITVTPA